MESAGQSRRQEGLRSVRHSQNFLHDAAVVRRIVGLAKLRAGDVVVEIGAGKGIITRELARVCGRVIAVECDRSLRNELGRALAGLRNVEVVWGDFRRYRLPECEYKVVASIPFNLTTEIVAKLTGGGRPPAEAYLIMQAEAARRFAGRPYGRESLKSLLLKPRFELSVVCSLRETDFRPAPGAKVVLLRMARRREPVLGAQEERWYRDFLCLAFSEHGVGIAERLEGVLTKRQMRRLAQENGFEASARVVDLSFAQWLAVFRYWRAEGQRRGLVEGAERRLARRQRGLRKVHRNRRAEGWSQWASGVGRKGSGRS